MDRRKLAEALAGATPETLRTSKHANIGRAIRFTEKDPRIEMTACGCWEWSGFRNERGYGQVRVYANGKPKVTGAHRAVYERMVGAIPDGLVIDHTCRNRACVNPEHLRAVTQRENALENSDCVSARWAKVTDCVRCGLPMTLIRDGLRGCQPCRAIHRKRYSDKKKALAHLLTGEETLASSDPAA